MKLDPTVMRTMNRQDYRVLAAVESGMQTRNLVPSGVIASLANLRHGGSHKILSSLLRDNLLSHDQSCGYDGYRVTNSGYDILALWNLKCRGVISALGDQIGVGKESDVYLAATPNGKQIVLKFHRLGRTSFRDVKKKRDYFMINSMKTSKHGVSMSTKDQPNSWLFLSKISALKEYTFMKALYDVDYPTPRPIKHNRHVVAMGLVRGIPLYQMRPSLVNSDQAQSIFEQAMDICKQLVKNGLVHCDLNEFNLMVDLSGGIQSKSHLDDDGLGLDDDGEDDIGDHYVRHSGSSASVMSRGKGALTLPHKVGGRHTSTMMDGTGEIVAETPEEPKEFLENGVDPKPIITLIDFPQMISVKHPNAKDLWLRDIECLKRFFVMKLKIDLKGADWDEFVPEWEELLQDLNEDDELEIDAELDEDGDDADSIVGGRSVSSALSTSSISVTSNASLVPMKQLRLDQELQASGFSKEDAGRQVELHYFTDTNGIVPVAEEEDEEDNDDDETSHNADNKNDGEEYYDGAISDIEDDEKKDKTAEVHVYRGNDDNSVAASVFSTSSRTSLSPAQMEQIARQRVRKQLEDRKKSKVRKNAYRTRNSNKTFVKGKRVFEDFTA